MRTAYNILLWAFWTVFLQLVFVAAYGLYEYAGGPYQCGFIDAGHYCGLLEYSINKGLIFNLAFGIPSIISGLISFFALKYWYWHKN